jgi:hypothetical protein
VRHLDVVDDPAPCSSRIDDVGLSPAALLWMTRPSGQPRCCASGVSPPGIVRSREETVNQIFVFLFMFIPQSLGRAVGLAPTGRQRLPFGDALQRSSVSRPRGRHRRPLRPQRMRRQPTRHRVARNDDPSATRVILLRLVFVPGRREGDNAGGAAAGLMARRYSVRCRPLLRKIGWTFSA